jgi:hypothetical protein
MIELKHVKDRVIIKVDVESKNSHKFENGQTIRLERKYNEFNRRITEPTNAEVISAENIPKGSEILIGHNALHDVNRIFNYAQLSGNVEGSDIRYYSIPEMECFAWRDADGSLKPMKNYAFGLRVYEPYKGFLEGIEPTLIENVLYITTGKLSGNICRTLKASDYEIIFQGQNGKEDHIIRCRHYEDECNDREEILAIDNWLTEKLNNGELLIGLTPSKAFELEYTAYAD